MHCAEFQLRSHHVATTSYLDHILPPNANVVGTLPAGALFPGKFLPRFQNVTFWPLPGNVVGTLPEGALFAGTHEIIKLYLFSTMRLKDPGLIVVEKQFFLL